MTSCLLAPQAPMQSDSRASRGAWLSLLALSLLISRPVQAQSADNLRQVERKIDESEKKQDALETAATEASKNLGNLRERMIESTEVLQEKEAEQETLESKLDSLTRAIAEKSKAAAQTRENLAATVAALVEIASRPPESLFLQERVTSDHINRTLLLQAIVPRLQRQADNAAQDLTALYDLQTQMESQKRLVEAARENLEKQQKALDQMIATRQGFLKRTEEQKAEVARQLAALSDQARDLRQLMARVAAANARTATPRKGNARDSVALRWPVMGSIRRGFGDKDADGVGSEGLTIAGPSGAAIVAPRGGKVVFAGPFRGYGLIVILQHEGGYHSFLSGFGRIDAEMKQQVAAGEPLGVLPLKSGTRPELYFEWRRGDDSLDPMAGLAKK